MIPFSDEDLKRLKEINNANRSVEGVTVFPVVKIESLLARLEAAEEVCKGIEIAHPKEENCGCSMCDCLDTWRKSKGETV